MIEEDFNMFTLSDNKMEAVRKMLLAMPKVSNDNMQINFSGCWGCEGGCKTSCETTCKSWNRR